MFDISENGDKVCMSVKSELTIATAKEFQQALQNILSEHSHQSIVMDLSGVSELDTSCLQLLLGANKQCKQANQTFELLNSSVPVNQTLGLYGLEHAFSMSNKSSQ